MALLTNCIFLYLGGEGICPHHYKKCPKKCDKFAEIGDNSKPIFQDWDDGINKLAVELREKYFGTRLKSKEEKEMEDFLG